MAHLMIANLPAPINQILHSENEVYKEYCLWVFIEQLAIGLSQHPTVPNKQNFMLFQCSPGDGILLMSKHLKIHPVDF